jgi:hypothetical protein
VRRLAVWWIGALVLSLVGPAFASGPMPLAAARRIFERAQKSAPGPERDRLWRQAAALYEEGLNIASDGDDAPEAAINGAFAYRQVGAPDRAAELYAKLIASYGAEAILDRFAKGDGAKKLAPSPARLAERVKYLELAYDALATARFASFRYPEAAETFARMASLTRFEEPWRRQAANNGVVLFGVLGDDARGDALARTFLALHPSAEEKARVELLLAERLYARWSPEGADEGDNKKTRAAAEKALTAFYEKNRTSRDATRALVEVAYRVARLKRAGGDAAGARTWFARVPELVAATGPGPVDTALADLSAEAELRIVDDEIRAKWDGPSNRRGYCGTLADVFGTFDPRGDRVTEGAFDRDERAARAFADRLYAIARAHAKSDWAAEALARGGAVFERLRTSLSNTTTDGGKDSCIQLFTPQQTAGPQAVGDMRDLAKERWRAKTAERLDAVAKEAISRYAQAAALGNGRAAARLVFYADVVGEARIASLVTATRDPSDPSRTLRYAPGMYASRAPGIHPLEAAVLRAPSAPEPP